MEGVPVYEITRAIAAHEELVVYYLPDQDRPKELFYAQMRSILNRRTMDSILEVLEGKCYTHEKQQFQSDPFDLILPKSDQ